MKDAVHSELLKIRSTQVWIWMVVAAVGLTALVTSGTVANERASSPAHDYVAIFTAAQTAAITMLVLGLLGFTTEFRHKTMTPTLLGTPNRLRLVGAKAVTYILLAIVYASLCVAVNLAIAVPWLSAKGIPVKLGGDVPGALVKCWVLLVYGVLLGLAIGALVRHQAVAMAGGVIYFTVLNGIWSVIPKVRDVWPFSPAGASTVFASSDRGRTFESGVPHLSTTEAALVMVFWVVVPLLVSAWLMRRRDIS